MKRHRIPVAGTIGVEITLAGLQAALAATPAGARPVLELNSDGGSVQEAVAIYNALRVHAGGVEVEVIGWALSAATVVAMAGTVVRAHETALFMIHAPWMSTTGNAGELREKADVLDQVARTMRTAYGRSRQAARTIDAWLDGADHWFTADEALAAGLVDEVISSSERAAVAVDIRACKFNVPQPLQERIRAMPQPTPQPGAAGASNEAEIRAAAVRAENQRQADIRAAFTPYTKLEGAQATLEACLSDPAVDLVQAKARILDLKARGIEPASSGYFARDPGDQRMPEFFAAAGDVLLQRAGIRVKEPHPAAKDLQRLGIVGMAERVLSMRGVSTRDMGRAEIINAAMSTSDFPSLLANVAGKALRAGYGVAPATFVGWTGEREVADFKAQSLVALSEAPGLLKVGAGAEYKAGEFGESASSFSVETYGRLVNITRQALINDDTSAFTGIPAAMGAAARRLEAELVYTKLTSNPVLGDGVALFHATHGNLSAAGAPSLTTLGIARAAMRKQKGIAGSDYIDPTPRYLIVPVELETACEQLLASLVDPSKSNDTPNVEWVRGLTLVADPRLDAVSTSQWYLAAAPQQVDGIVRGYLESQDRPYLAQEEGFKADVTSFKVRLDVCAGVIDYRALHRNG